MKVAGIINVSLQGFGLIGTIISLLLCYMENEQNGYSGNHYEQNAAIISVIACAIMCGYQLIHAFVMSILKLVNKTFSWLFGIYWILCLAYLLGWIVVLVLSNTRNMGDDVLFTGVFLGWIPVLYYIAISIIDLRKAFRA